MSLERVVCPKCKYIMVQPFRKNCPNCYYDLQKEILQQEEKYKAFLLKRRTWRKAEQDRIKRERDLQKFKGNYRINRNTTPISKKINENLTLKLERGRINLYVNGKLFIQCKRLVLNIKKEEIPRYDEIESIDEASKIYNEHLFQSKIVTGPMAVPTPNQNHDITLEQEFWGHCSNIQAWVENDYDTRILMSNLSFPLLKELARLGDPKAIKVYKEEIALRLESGYPSVVQYLLIQGYLGEFNPSEFQTILESNILIKKLSPHPKVLTQFLISSLYFFPTLTENITLRTLKLPNGKDIIISVIQFEPKVATYKPWIKFIPRYIFYLKETLEKFLEHDDENTYSDIPEILQAIDQQMQILRSEGYMVKPAKDKDRIDKTFKVVLVGMSSKKSRLLTEIPTLYEEKKLPFNLVSVPIYFEKQNAKINLVIWDIQHNNHLYMSRSYLADAKAAILVFHIKGLSNHIITQFLTSLSPYLKKTFPKIIVGIKEDMEPERKQSENMAEELSKFLKAPYFEISLINRDNVYKIFHKVAELAFKEPPIEPTISIDEERLIDKEISAVKKDRPAFISSFQCNKCKYVLNSVPLYTLLTKGRVYCPRCGRIIKRTFDPITRAMMLSSFSTRKKFGMRR